MNTLSDTRGMLIIDWGMKVLPQEYLESSKNWFGKKGKHFVFSFQYINGIPTGTSVSVKKTMQLGWRLEASREKRNI